MFISFLGNETCFLQLPNFRKIQRQSYELLTLVFPSQKIVALP
jgi:hypothetical protein